MDLIMAERRHMDTNGFMDQLKEAEDRLDVLICEAFEKERGIDLVNIAEQKCSFEHMTNLREQKKIRLNQLIQTINNADRLLMETSVAVSKRSEWATKITRLRERVEDADYRLRRAKNELTVAELDLQTLDGQIKIRNSKNPQNPTYDLFIRLDKANHTKSKLLEQNQQLTEEINNEHVVDCAMDKKMCLLINSFNGVMDEIKCNDNQISVHLSAIGGLNAQTCHLTTNYFNDAERIKDFYHRYQGFLSSGQSTDIRCDIKKDCAQLDNQKDILGHRIKVLESEMEPIVGELELARDDVENLQRKLNERNAAEANAVDEQDREIRNLEENIYRAKGCIQDNKGEVDRLTLAIEQATVRNEALKRVLDENKHKAELMKLDMEKEDEYRSNDIHKCIDLLHSVKAKIRADEKEGKQENEKIKKLINTIKRISKNVESLVERNAEISRLYFESEDKNK
ncbi:hypothetical protein ACOME3_009768 [Neoechinorhynchus agilis]